MYSGKVVVELWRWRQWWRLPLSYKPTHSQSARSTEEKWIARKPNAFGQSHRWEMKKTKKWNPESRKSPFRIVSRISLATKKKQSKTKQRENWVLKFKVEENDFQKNAVKWSGRAMRTGIVFPLHLDPYRCVWMCECTAECVNQVFHFVAVAFCIFNADYIQQKIGKEWWRSPVPDAGID